MPLLALPALCSPTRWCTHWTCELQSLSSPQISQNALRRSSANEINSVKTRLQVQMKRNPSSVDTNPADEEHYASTLDAITKIIKADGITGLYAGMPGSLIGVASTNFAYFYWYTVVRTLYLQYRSTPGTAAELSLGAVAGAVAQLFTIPVAVVTTRQQTVSKHERKGLIATGKEVIESEDGWTGLWRGLKASLVLVVNPAITYGAYQRLREALFPGKATLKPWEAFGMSYVNSEQRRKILTHPSPRRHVQSPCNHRNAATHRRQGRLAVKTPSSSQRQAVQNLWRGHAIHCSARGPARPLQGHRPTDYERPPSARFLNDDQRTHRTFFHPPLPISPPGARGEIAEACRHCCREGASERACVGKVE